MDFNSQEGEVILVDKPLDWTSFNVVKKVKWLFKIKKVGHAGTLDPLATGLLILCTGKKTKTIDSIQTQTKEYTGIITLGNTTPSYDLELDFDANFETAHITSEMIENVRKQFLGETDQLPPIFSALKVKGRKAYDLAREGKEVILKTRKINIYEFEIPKVEGNNIHFEIQCSKGTYIRSIAHDFGKLLDSGAHLSNLRRTKIGDYSVEDAYSIDDLIALKEEIASN